MHGLVYLYRWGTESVHWGICSTNNVYDQYVQYIRGYAVELWRSTSSMCLNCTAQSSMYCTPSSLLHIRDVKLLQEDWNSHFVWVMSISQKDSEPTLVRQYQYPTQMIEFANCTPIQKTCLPNQSLRACFDNCAFHIKILFLMGSCS